MAQEHPQCACRLGKGNKANMQNKHLGTKIKGRSIEADSTEEKRTLGVRPNAS